MNVECSACGESAMARVVWNASSMPKEAFESCIESGALILGSRFQSHKNLPHSVCLRCEPRWLDVHEMVKQDCEWQFEKEFAVEENNMESAARIKSLQEDIRSKATILVANLLKKKSHEGPKGNPDP